GVAALERLRVDELLDHLGRLRADDVAAEQLAVLLVADDLDGAGLAGDRRAADRAVGDLADDDVVALLLGLRLGQAERADVGAAERRPRDVDVADRMRLEALDVLGRDHALVGRLVRQGRTGDQVADRPDTLARRAQAAVDLD